MSSSRIEEIVAKDINGVLYIDTEPTFPFPKVTSLELYNLHQLKSLYQGAHTSQWPFQHSNKDIMRDVRLLYMAS